MLSKFHYLEEFTDSFPNLDAELIQLSKGFFNSEAQTFVFDDFAVDKRRTEAVHIHHSVVHEDTINLVFPNNITSHHIKLNNQQLSHEHQILAFSGEEAFSVLPKDFFITTLTLHMSILQEYLDFDLNNFCPTLFRAKRVNLDNKSNLLAIIESIFQECLFSNNCFSNEVITDMRNTLYMESAKYLSHEIVNHDLGTRVDGRIKLQQKKKIIETLTDMPLQALNLDILAKESLVSKRNLNNRCKEFFDLTPNQLIVLARLNKAYKTLSSQTGNKVTVSKVMQDCGVTNISRFNRSYSQLFGELPIETIKRKKMIKKVQP